MPKAAPGEICATPALEKRHRYKPRGDPTGIHFVRSLNVRRHFHADAHDAKEEEKEATEEGVTYDRGRGKRAGRRRRRRLMWGKISS